MNIYQLNCECTLEGKLLSFANCCGLYAPDVGGIKSRFELQLNDRLFFSLMLIFKEGFLKKADFSRAVLTNVDFRDADLRYADFENCNLKGSDFRGARLEGTRFPGAILERCYGLIKP